MAFCYSSWNLDGLKFDSVLRDWAWLQDILLYAMEEASVGFRVPGHTLVFQEDNQKDALLGGLRLCGLHCGMLGRRETAQQALGSCNCKDQKSWLLRNWKARVGCW